MRGFKIQFHFKIEDVFWTTVLNYSYGSVMLMLLIIDDHEIAVDLGGMGRHFYRRNNLFLPNNKYIKSSHSDTVFQFSFH